MAREGVRNGDGYADRLEYAGIRRAEEGSVHERRHFEKDNRYSRSCRRKGGEKGTVRLR